MSKQTTCQQKRRIRPPCRHRQRRLGPAATAPGGRQGLVGQAATAGGGRPSARAVMGSPGYLDPHLLRSGVATKKSDVYSFGVLLLELLTGKEAVCRETGHRLTAAVGPMLRDGEVSDVLDQRLGAEYDAAEATAVAELAMQCVSDDPALRPSMADVVRLLEEKTSAVGSKSDRKMMS